MCWKYSLFGALAALAAGALLAFPDTLWALWAGTTFLALGGIVCIFVLLFPNFNRSRRAVGFSIGFLIMLVFLGMTIRFSS